MGIGGKMPITKWLNYLGQFLTLFNTNLRRLGGT